MCAMSRNVRENQKHVCGDQKYVHEKKKRAL